MDGLNGMDFLLVWLPLVGRGERWGIPEGKVRYLPNLRQGEIAAGQCVEVVVASLKHSNRLLV